MATTLSIGSSAGTCRAAVVAGVCAARATGSKAATLRSPFIIPAATPGKRAGSLKNYLGVEEAVGGAAGFSGTAVGGLRAAFAESAELRIFEASWTDRSKPASFREYLYF